MRSLACLAIAGCAGAPGTGVHERITSTVPQARIALPVAIGKPNSVRIGASGATGPKIATAPGVTEGARTTASTDGEVYAGLALPGGTDTAMWELAAGATTSDGLRGGYVQLDAGAFGDRGFGIFGAFAIRGAQVAFDWDYGDCAGGSACTTWNPKGPSTSERELGIGANGSVFLAQRSANWSVFGGAGFDVSPTIATGWRESIMCDGNGNCTGGAKPARPPLAYDAASIFAFGADATISIVRAYAAVIFVGEDRVAHARGGIEVRF